MAKNINWTEGTFIQPHHFQQAFLEIEDRLNTVVSEYVPHFYGVSRLEIGPCDQYQFEILQIDCRFPDGTRVVGGTQAGDFKNAVIEPSEFEKQLTKAGRLDVYIGLPKLRWGDGNCLRFNEKAMGGHRHRYISREDSLPDLVAGENEQTLEHKLYQPRILFRWKGEDGEVGDSIEGYDLLKLAELGLSTQRGEYRNVPEIRKTFVPPCTNMNASPVLSTHMGTIMSRLEAKYLNLRDYWKHKNTATDMKTRDTFKVQAVTAATFGLRQFKSLDRLHPFTLYVKLAEIMGTLSIYTNNDTFLEFPEYKHNELGPCFTKITENMEKLLALLEETIFEFRTFESQSNNLLLCPVEESWLEESKDLFICFESPLSEQDVVKESLGLKIASADTIDYLNQKRLRGVKLEGPVHHLSNLPTSSSHHYFRLPRDTIFFPKLIAHPTLAIWGKQFAELVKLYIVDKEKL